MPAEPAAGAAAPAAPEGPPQRFDLSVPARDAGHRLTRLGPLAGYRWAPSDAADARPLVIVHGFAEHARRHSELALAASRAGHPVWALDLPGHGESPGPRAVVDGYEDAIAAVSALVSKAAREGRAGPPVLFGHSMGGAIGLRFAQARPELLAGLVLSSPFLLDAVPRPTWLLSVGRLVAKLVPRMVVATVDANAISRDPAEVARYRGDPLVHTSGVPAVSGSTLTEEGAAALADAGRLQVPTLILHGSADGIASVEGSRRLAAAADPELVDYVELEGGYHELFHDVAASGVPDKAAGAVLGFLAVR